MLGCLLPCDIQELICLTNFLKNVVSLDQLKYKINCRYLLKIT